MSLAKQLRERCTWETSNPAVNDLLAAASELEQYETALKLSTDYAELLKRAADPLRIIVEDLAQDITPTAAWRKEVLAEWAKVATQSSHEIGTDFVRCPTCELSMTRDFLKHHVCSAKEGHAVGALRVRLEPATDGVVVTLLPSGASAYFRSSCEIGRGVVAGLPARCEFSQVPKQEPRGVLVCRERDGECPTPGPCWAQGCPLETSHAQCNPQEPKA